MPKQTYFNLSDEKKNKVYDTLVNCFENRNVKNVTVKEIVEKLNIPRGSFYQYFDSVNEAYFYVLEQELVEPHENFQKLLKNNDMNILTALDLFGEVAADTIFTEKNYRLYRSRYLFMDIELEKQWKAYRMKNAKYGQNILSVADSEKMMFISAVIHFLIQRLFTEDWGRTEFLERYERYIKWIKRGIEK